MITIILSIIAIIISLVSISFQIYSWIKNKMDNMNLRLIILLDNTFEKYNNLEYKLEEIIKTDENIRKYTIRFYEHYEKYLLEIINNLKVNNYLLLDGIICNNCNKNYKFKELFEFLDNWKFKNTYKDNPHIAVIIMKIINQGSITIKKIISEFNEAFKIFFNIKIKKLSTLSCPNCLKKGSVSKMSITSNFSK